MGGRLLPLAPSTVEQLELVRGDEHGENSSATPETLVAIATLVAAAADGGAALACLKSHRHGARV